MCMNQYDQKSTHSRICDAAGERNSTLLSATVSSVTAEVDVQFPVVGFLSSTAVVLLKEQMNQSDETRTFSSRIFVVEVKKNKTVDFGELPFSAASQSGSAGRCRLCTL